MVAFGTLLSSFWILAANSWMQTPAGYEIIDGRFFPTDWFAVIFNPSFPYRLAHTVVGFYMTTGFVVVAVGAYLIRKHGALGRGPHHAVDHVLAADDPGSAADFHRRPAWPQHAASISRPSWRRSKPIGKPAAACRWSCSPSPTTPMRTTISRSQIPLPWQLDPDAWPRRHGQAASRIFRATSGRRWRCRFSPSGSWSASAC